METGCLAVDEWAREWGMRQSGEWHPDTMITICCLVENRAPHLWPSLLEGREQYVALVAIAARYLMDVPDEDAANRLAGVVRRDIPPLADGDILDLKAELLSRIGEALELGRVLWVGRSPVS